MTPDYLSAHAGRRRLVLPAVAALHVLLAWLWMAWPATPLDAADDRRMILLRFLEPLARKATPPVITAKPPSTNATRPARAISSKAATPLATPAETEPQSAAVTVTAPLPPDPFALEAAPATPLITQAKKDAVQFDRQVNKDRLKGITPFEERPFVKAIAGAHVGTGTTITEYKSADGRPITKVTVRGRSYCVMALENHSVMSETLGRQGANTRKVNCPK